MTSNSASKCTLNSPADWDKWDEALQNLARSRKLYNILMGIEEPISEPDQPFYDDFVQQTQPDQAPGDGPYRGTRRQTNLASTQRTNTSDAEGGTQASSNTEEGDNMNPERAALIAEASRMHNESRAERRYNARTKEYSQTMHRYEIQRKDIEQTFTWIRDSVSAIYLESHVSVTYDWVKAYNNLKTALNPGSREIKRSIREAYDQHMRALTTRTKDLDTWINKWEQLINKGKGKSMTFALDKEDWSTRFIEAIRPLDPVWVTTLEHDVEEKLDDDTLTYGDMSRYFRRLITKINKSPRSTSRVAKGSFATRQQGGDNISTEETKYRGRQANVSPDRRGRSRSRSTDYSRKRDYDSMENSNSRQHCAGCGGLHLIWGCFYLFPHLAPPGWNRQDWLVGRINRFLEADSPLAQEVKRLLSGKERAPPR
jgi:hypothetical protein